MTEVVMTKIKRCLVLSPFGGELDYLIDARSVVEGAV